MTENQTPSIGLLTHVIPTGLTIRMAGINFNILQSVFAEPLLAARQIISQYQVVWRKREPSTTSKNLREAMFMINGFLVAIAGIKEYDEVEMYNRLASAFKRFIPPSDIVMCICCNRNATLEEKSHVMEHRHELQDYLLSFLEVTFEFFTRRYCRNEEQKQLVTFLKKQIDIILDEIDIEQQLEAPQY